jgi:4-amino-4-deoxy-L-arabinose transferase-like glycosyltransferase
MSGDDKGRQAAVVVAVLALSGIGVLMSMQSTSLLQGTDRIWLGVAVAAAGLVLSLFALGDHPIRLLAGIALVVALGSALYMEHEVDQKRQEIADIFDIDPATGRPR